MGISMTVDHARRLTFARAEGLITADHIRAHLQEERQAEGLRYPELIDARGFHPGFSPAQVRTIVADIRHLAPRLGPTAVIVDTDVGFGILRMLEVLVEDVCSIRPFRRQEDAEQWLAEVR